MNDLLLVRLPAIPGVDHEFYGVGYNSDSGFIFTLITPEIRDKFPSRILPYKGMYALNDQEITILGKIEDLPPIRI